jgi:hypothetical protein
MALSVSRRLKKRARIDTVIRSDLSAQGFEYFSRGFSFHESTIFLNCPGQSEWKKSVVGDNAPTTNAGARRIAP